MRRCRPYLHPCLHPCLSHALSILVLAGLAACASPAANDGVILVETLARGDGGERTELNGVNCTVTVSSANWKVTTPYLLSRSSMNNTDGELHFACTHAGYRPSEVTIHPAEPSNASIGIGFGGRHAAFGMVFPLLLGNKAGNNYVYPERIMIEMRPQDIGK